MVVLSLEEAVGKPDPRISRLDVIEKALKIRNDIQSRGGI
jgi:para-nitrobenzyl esterase